MYTSSDIWYNYFKSIFYPKEYPSFVLEAFLKVLHVSAYEKLWKVFNLEDNENLCWKRWVKFFAALTNFFSRLFDVYEGCSLLIGTCQVTFLHLTRHIWIIYHFIGLPFFFWMIAQIYVWLNSAKSYNSTK